MANISKKDPLGDLVVLGRWGHVGNRVLPLLGVVTNKWRDVLLVTLIEYGSGRGSDTCLHCRLSFSETKRKGFLD